MSDWMIWNPSPSGSAHGSQNASRRRTRYGCTHQHHVSSGNYNEQCAYEVAVMQAGRKHHGGNDEHQRHGGPEIGLKKNERDERSHDDGDEGAANRTARQSGASCAREERREQYTGDFGEFGRLNAEAAQASHRRVPLTGALNSTPSVSATTPMSAQIKASFR